MSDEWKNGWIDEVNGEKVYWCFLRDKTEEELKEVKKEWEESNALCDCDDDKLLFEDWCDNQDYDVRHFLEKPKTDEEWNKSVLCIECDKGAEGMYCFSENPYDIPTIEDGDESFSDYTKLRILNLVMLGHLESIVLDWMFRNWLMNYITDNGKITDEQFKELNKL